jgi:hypothetical protein
MNITTVKKAQKRIDYPNIANLDILGYGKNNLYPQELKNIAGCSDSAVSCLNRYANFIEGNGFLDIPFAETVLNSQKQTADDLVALIAGDIANFGGFALHVNYNLLGKISEVQHIPFENCRLTEPNEKNIVEKIAVHIDWTGKTKIDGKLVKVSKENIDYIHVFNPSTALKEIENCGGVDNYKGQILYSSVSGMQTYPIPRHDVIIPQMSTEEGLANISNLNARNNFLPSGFVFVNETLDTVDNANEGVQMELPFKNNIGIESQLADIKSDENTSSIAIVRPNRSVEKIDDFF